MQLVWDLNLRTNLKLWPEVGANIRALAGSQGELYDENALLARFPDTGEKRPTDERAVRNTFEVLAHAGLAYRDDDNRLRLSDLGHVAFTFLGVTGPKSYVNAENGRLLAAPLLRALSTVAEVRATWVILRAAGGSLSNEELNRAIARTPNLEDASAAGAAVLDARAAGDVSLIGPRAYDDAGWGTATESDQRKAINPHFLLAGAGGLAMNMDAQRALVEWAVPMVDATLRDVPPLQHASTDSAAVLSMSRAACVPGALR